MAPVDMGGGYVSVVYVKGGNNDEPLPGLSEC